jgi:hypothetical protein
MSGMGLKGLNKIEMTLYTIVQTGLFGNIETLNEFLKTIVAENVIEIRMTNAGYFVQYYVSVSKKEIE